MASLFTLPNPVPVSAGGSYPSARLYFFQAGTTTPISTYTTSALSVAHAHPVVADANGVFAPIWINEATNPTYRMQLKTSADVLIKDVDNLIASARYYPRTAAEVTAGVTPSNYAYPSGDVRRYGATGDGSTDDLAAFDAAAAVMGQCGGGEITCGPAESYRVSATFKIQYDRVVLNLNGSTILTTADTPVVQVGADAAGTSIYSFCGVKNGVIDGSGAGNTANNGLVIRNVSYGQFRNLRITDCWAKALLIQAYTRGVQYNLFDTVEITENHNGALTLDTGSAAGGYVNDNTFVNFRAHENPNTGGTVTHCNFIGTQTLNSNRFYSFAIETQGTAHTLLDIDNGSDNTFDGIRLDGVGGSTVALDIASGCDGNVFLNPNVDGTIADASNTTVLLYNQGAGNLPFLRFGSAAGAANSWDIGLNTPGGVKELHIKYNDAANGIVRFPSNTEVFFGDRSGGDNAPITIIGENKRLDLSTLGDTAIGSGPTIRFDGRFSSSGNEGTVTIQQDGYGLSITPSVSGDMLYVAGGVIGIADGVTAPASVSGRAQIYVDASDGDLKVKFGDGTVKTLVTDT